MLNTKTSLMNLIPVWPCNLSWNSIATSPGGRVFVALRKAPTEPGIRLGEILQNQQIVAYPDTYCNGEGCEKRKVRFSSIQTVKFCDQGRLWLLDAPGSSARGPANLPPVLYEIDIESGKIESSLNFAGYELPGSLFADFAISRDFIFLSDCGTDELLVIRKDTGARSRIPMYRQPGEAALHEDKARRRSEHFSGHGQLGISSDKKSLLFKASADRLLEFNIEGIANTGASVVGPARTIRNSLTAGPFALDNRGVIYWLDNRYGRLWTLGNDQQLNMIFQSRRLVNANTLQIDNDGFAWITVPAEYPSRGDGSCSVHIPLFLMKI